MITDQVVEFLWWLMRRTGLESNLNDFEANYRSGFIIYIHCTPAEAGLEWERCVSLSIFAQFKCKNFCLGFKAQCKIKFTYSPTESEEALKFLVKMFQDSWNEYLQHKLLNMYKMLQVKVDCLARNLNFQKKHPQNIPKLQATLGYPRFENRWMPNCWHQVNFWGTPGKFGISLPRRISVLSPRWFFLKVVAVSVIFHQETSFRPDCLLEQFGGNEM